METTSHEREWGKELRHASGDGCLPPSALDHFVDGTASKRERDEVLLHLGHCRACRAAILELRASRRAERERSKWGVHQPRFRLAAGSALFGLILLAGYGAYRSSSIRTAVGTPTTVRSRSDNFVASVGTEHRAPAEETRRSAPNSISHSVLSPREQHKDTELVASNDAGGSADSGVRAMKLCLILGASHVYKVDEKDAHQDQRKQIEQSYADAVAEKRDKYSHTLKSGSGHYPSEKQLKHDLEDLSAERERRLAELYPIADDLREKHPELKVETCGPCPVVQFSSRADGVPDPEEDFVVVEPWPGYEPQESPYGWTYGRHYGPDEFQQEYQSWREVHSQSGQPVFYGLEGRNGPIVADEIRRNGNGNYRIHTLRRSRSRAETASRYARTLSSSKSISIISHKTQEPKTTVTSVFGGSRYSRSLEGSTRPNASNPSQPSRYSHTLEGSHYPPSQDRIGSYEAPRSKYLRGSSGH